MTVPPGGVLVVSAYLIAMLSCNIASQVIDWFGVPIPRQVFNMPWSLGFGIAAVMMLLPYTTMRAVLQAGLGVFSMFVILGYWACIEGFQGADGRSSNYGLIFACIPAILTYQAARLHLEISKNPWILEDAFVNSVVCISFLHFLLMAGNSIDEVAPYLNSAEISDRNSVSILLAGAILVAGVLDRRKAQPDYQKLIVLIPIAIAHILLNSARAAAVLLMVGLCGIALRRRLRNSIGLPWFFLLVSVLVIVAVSYSQPIMDELNAYSAFGGGRSELSTRIRTVTNILLLEQFLENPIMGIGWDGVMGVKSGGYFSHTFFLITLAAYGIAGVIPIVVMLSTWLKNIPRESLGILSFTLFGLVVTMCFVNDPLEWYGTVFALASYGLFAGEEYRLRES